MKKLINDCIDYIIRHLDENITAKDIANEFNYSEFYFNRVFKSETGESLYAFIKRLKMEQSAIDIKIKNNKSITDIGLDYGYSSSNYSSAFRKHHDVSPAKFRKSANKISVLNPFAPNKLDSFESFDHYASKIQIRILEDITVIYEKTIGNYYELKEKWFRFMETYKEFIKTNTLMIERFYDDPLVSSSNCCICDLCMTVNKDCQLENITAIKGGKFAVYRFEGKIEDIFCAVQGVFSIWLPQSKYEMTEKYGLNIYHNIDNANSEVVMDLCIPIK
ncbi:MAG: AraC family transcriptional regulator [Candidatus Wallbacteria bacterium]